MALRSRVLATVAVLAEAPMAAGYACGLSRWLAEQR